MNARPYSGLPAREDRSVKLMGRQTTRCRVSHTRNTRSPGIVNRLVEILIAIFLPPVAVFLKRGVGKDLLINILLCLLLFFPGMVHALWVVSN